MEEEKDKEEKGIGIGGLLTVGVIVMILIIGVGVYQYVTAPFRIADELKERLDSYGNVSSDYRQGYLDCVANYLKITVEPTNITSEVE